MPQFIIGCDLCRAVIDAHFLPGGRTDQVANSPEAIAEWVADLPPEARFVFEATSGCDAPLIAVLAERNIPFSRVNPRQARAFARATGVEARAGAHGHARPPARERQTAQDDSHRRRPPVARHPECHDAKRQSAEDLMSILTSARKLKSSPW